MTFNCYDGSVGEWCLNFEFDLRNFVVDKLPDDGTFVPKHVIVDT